jgi:hypothetical protein
LKLQARRSFHFVVVKHVVVFISARLWLGKTSLRCVLIARF